MNESITKTKSFDLVNPSTGEVFRQVADADVTEMRAAIGRARAAFDSGLWPGMSAAERGIYLKKIAKIIRTHARELAELETLNVGKTSKQSTFIDIPTAAETFEYFADAGRWLEDEINPVDAPVESVSAREPIGVVACIIPWNYPLIMFGWKVAPALAAGNTVVFKPSRLGCASILRLAELIEKESGLPEGVLTVVATTDQAAAQELVLNPNVDMLSFTGGTETGRYVMQAAARTVKKLSLELGGKSPNIVFADCAFDAALGGTLSAIFMNQGQMCTAGSRLILEESIYEKFLAALVERTQALSVGPANAAATEFGPVISKEHRDRILKYIEQARGDGAIVACGGKIPAGTDPNGFYIEPAILTNVDPKSPAAQEEIFGPVLTVFKFKTAREAVELANDTPFGLAACVWTKDLQKAKDTAKRIQAGTVWINTYGGFYNGAAFGGYKQSGFGRELGREGLLEYTRSKHICLDQTPGGTPLAASWF